MKQYKNKIIFAFVVIALLVASFFYGGNVTNENKTPSDKHATEAVQKYEEKNTKKQTLKQKKESEEKKEAKETTKKEETNEASLKKEPEKKENEKETESTSVKNEKIVEEQKETETENTKNNEKLTCTLSVSCNTILENLSQLDKEKHALVPEDGIIFKEKEVVFYEGESVFNVLLREMKQNKIHFEFVNVPIFKSAYIEGIANLYEFDCGELSGWMYRVNGEFPNYGCSQYTVKKGDKIEWLYTCDLGKDIGGEESAKNGISK